MRADIEYTKVGNAGQITLYTLFRASFEYLTVQNQFALLATHVITASYSVLSRVFPFYFAEKVAFPCHC